MRVYQKKINDFDAELVNFHDKIIINDIGDLFEAGSKFISVLLYMTLWHFGISWHECNDFLKQTGDLTSETAHKWAEVFLSGNFYEFVSEADGEKHVSSFYDIFSDIKSLAVLFSSAMWC
ncbi:unnamed protein product [Didymodactylos carnosus]|uniref:Uncharacterized protein n=1 Tax=Didymodactylos carnosus TaxID=1234261 RepID=A0A8S2FS13_9BILA|nr:unnamed protein product [Didymodactylos carnosus]CAF4319775.1 unnamed protein product [Didymodactylos carnosus]